MSFISICFKHVGSKLCIGIMNISTVYLARLTGQYTVGLDALKFTAGITSCSSKSFYSCKTFSCVYGARLLLCFSKIRGRAQGREFLVGGMFVMIR